MTRIQTLSTLLALALSAATAAADSPATSLDTASTPPAPASTATEPPYQGDPVVTTADQRIERSLRTVQIALERTRSDRIEDQDKVVCVKQEMTGSHRQVINCATNRYWRAMRDSSLASLGGFGGGSARKDEQVFTMKVEDYYKLEKRFGKLPEEMLSLK